MIYHFSCKFSLANSTVAVTSSPPCRTAPLSLPYRPSPSYTERSKWIIILAANDLTHSHLWKILGSICAEDFQHLTLYQPLTDQASS